MQQNKETVTKQAKTFRNLEERNAYTPHVWRGSAVNSGKFIVTVGHILKEMFWDLKAVSCVKNGDNNVEYAQNNNFTLVNNLQLYFTRLGTSRREMSWQFTRNCRHSCYMR